MSHHQHICFVPTDDQEPYNDPEDDGDGDPENEEYIDDEHPESEDEFSYCLKYQRIIDNISSKVCNMSCAKCGRKVIRMRREIRWELEHGDL